MAPRSTAATLPAVAATWSELARAAPDGLAVIDADGRFVRLNEAAAVAMGGRHPADAEALVGATAPFALTEVLSTDGPGLLEDGAGELVCTWAPASGPQREFAYRTKVLDSNEPGRGFTAVAFRDVTDERQRQRRLAAIARTSAKLATVGSLTATLDALAREVLRADALAGVQILTVDDTGSGLQIMGSAGFGPSSDFFDRLMRCRDRGAALRTIDALESREPIVVPHRWATIRDDPAWEPLHAYLGELNWDWFACVPLMIRGRAAGILNAFYTPGQVVGRRALEFLVAMAEQAAVAVDYAALVRNERETARRDERRRLARDLHDSIVQQVFSIGMQASSMGVLGQRGDPVPAASVRRIADEVGTLSRTVLADLRAMVHELRPLSSAQLGLAEAVRALAESTGNRTGLSFALTIGKDLEQVTPEMAEDVYRIVAEAIHNVVKHADASRITVRLGVREHAVALTVADDGVGLRATRSTDSHGYGLTGMRERAERWGGTVRIRQRATAGTSVRAVLPLPITRAPVPWPEPQPVRPEDQ